MNKRNADFDTWFSTLSILVLERTGVDFNDEDSVKQDYEDGKDMFDVVDSIAEEYNS